LKIPRDIAKKASPANAGRAALPKAVRRTIDRLSRAAHRFHRFAHHPLCDRYAGEVVRIGARTRLCRGCTNAVLGGLAGGVLGIIATDAIAIASVIAAVALIGATLYAKRRPSKLVTRLVPAALFALALAHGAVARAPLALAAAFAAATSAGGLRFLYGRRGADRTPCMTCPERERQPCSGLRPILSRERAFQRVAGSWILRR
jgi:hypothetical protein